MPRTHRDRVGSTKAVLPFPQSYISVAIMNYLAMTNYWIRVSSSMRGPSLALVLFLSQLVPPFACGQSGTSGALTGLVMDASRAVVAGATVTARDVNTGAVRTGQTDSSGRFLLAQLNPGTYQIEVMALGFAIQHSPPIVVAAGQTVTANFTLAPA